MQRLHRLLDGDGVVETMNLKEVDVVRGEAGQTRASRSVIHDPVDLGRQDYRLSSAVPLDGASHDFLGRAGTVDVRGVPEGDAELDGFAEDRVGCVPVERPGTSGARLAETHAAKREAADLEP